MSRCVYIKREHFNFTNVEVLFKNNFAKKLLDSMDAYFDFRINSWNWWWITNKNLNVFFHKFLAQHYYKNVVPFFPLYIFEIFYVMKRLEKY